jgi:hypothetical protein
MAFVVAFINPTSSWPAFIYLFNFLQYVHEFVIQKDYEVSLQYQIDLLAQAAAQW